jgi:hypothetical protein
VLDAGLLCVWGDGIVHSDLIEVPKYDQTIYETPY